MISTLSPVMTGTLASGASLVSTIVAIRRLCIA